MVWENKTRVPATLGLRGYSFFAETEIRESRHLMPTKFSVRHGKCDDNQRTRGNQDHAREDNDQFAEAEQNIR